MNTVVASATAAPPAVHTADALIEVRLTAIRYAARDTNIYEFTSRDGKPLPAYQPGAHIDVHLPNGIVRQYSLLEPEPEPQRYMIGVKRDPASRGGSRYVHDELRVGRALKISAPRNNFPLAEDARHVILFAGGIGILRQRGSGGALTQRNEQFFRLGRGDPFQQSDGKPCTVEESLPHGLS